MKKITFILGLFLFISGLSLKAQVSYEQIASIVKAKLPNLDINNKIIALHVWSANNNDSREANKEFDRMYKAYEFAKLKNGNKGLVVVSVSTDDLTTANITAGKDGISKLVSIHKSDYAFLSNSTSGYNVVFDNTFAKVFENLSSSKVLPSLNSLITR